MREVKRRYWDEDLSLFGEQFTEAKGGYVYQEPAISAEEEFLLSLDEGKRDLMPEVFVAMSSLTPKQRFVIECRYGLRSNGRQMNVEEIAEALGISQPAVTKLIQRSLKRLEGELWRVT